MTEKASHTMMKRQERTYRRHTSQSPMARYDHPSQTKNLGELEVQNGQ